MFIKDLHNCREIIASDNTILREILKPDADHLNLPYSLAHAVVKQGCTTNPHRLTSSEIYYILEGTGVMHIDDEQAEVHPGQAIYIPPNSRQYITNTGVCDLKFLCIVAPPWRAENEEIL